MKNKKIAQKIKLEHIVGTLIVIGIFIFYTWFFITMANAVPSVNGPGLSQHFDQDFIPDHQPPTHVEPGQEKLVCHPNTPNICYWFPAGSITAPIQVESYYSGGGRLPPGVTPLANQVGTPFFFGAWIRGENRSISQFNPSIVINIKYADSGSAQIAEESRSALILEEERLRVNMYNPAIKSWIKLCTRVNRYTNEISGLLFSPTPFREGLNAGSTLFALAIDKTDPLTSTPDKGATTLIISKNARLKVLPGTVEKEVHFEATVLTDVPESNRVKLLPTPIDIKACRIDHKIVNNSRQITQFPKPLKIEFDYGRGTLDRARSRNNLTTVKLQNGQWYDMEEFDYIIIRDENKLTVDTDRLGTFSLAIR